MTMTAIIEIANLPTIWNVLNRCSIRLRILRTYQRPVHRIRIHRFRLLNNAEQLFQAAKIHFGANTYSLQQTTLGTDIRNYPDRQAFRINPIFTRRDHLITDFEFVVVIDVVEIQFTSAVSLDYTDTTVRHHENADSTLRIEYELHHCRVITGRNDS